MQENLKHILDLTYQAHKGRLSPLTGFVGQDGAISTYDNFLFCLVLFRMKTCEHVLEAKKLLERLLYFQQNMAELQAFGNFPVLLTDYPFCHDHLQALRIYYVNHWIMKEFSSVLGAELQRRLSESMKRSFDFLKKISPEVNFPLWAKLKLACLGIGEMIDLADRNDMRCWGDPGALAEMITAYQIKSEGQWQPFWRYLASVWHTPSQAFIGPAFKLGSQNPFFTWAMGLFTGKLPQGEPPLSCALLQPSSAVEEPHNLAGVNERFSWEVSQMPLYGSSLIIGRQSPEQMPGFFPYHLVSGPHSMAIQAPQGYQSSPFVYEIPESIFTDDKEKARGLTICFNDHKDNEVLVDGKKATCFEISDPVQIRLGALKLALSFKVLSGDGVLVGHISRANRSGLIQDRHMASDVQITLRAVRGSTPTRIQLFVSL